MVKGNSRQVIVVQAPDQKLFEQAIFILKDGPEARKGVTDEALLREAQRLLRKPGKPAKKLPTAARLLWAAGGGMTVGLCWLLTVLL